MGKLTCWKFLLNVKTWPAANNTLKNKKADIIGILTRKNIEAHYQRNI